MNDKPSYEELEKQNIELKKQIEIFRLHDSLHEEQKVSDYYFNTILNNIGDPIFVKDNQSRLLIVNDAFCEIFGLTRANIIGKTLAEDVTPDERESFLKIDKQVILDGVENINEESLTVRGGQVQTISTRKSRFKNSDGKIFLLGVIRNITDRKLSELKLKKQFVELQKTNNELDQFVYSVSHDLRAPLSSLLGLIQLAKMDKTTISHKNYLEMMQASVNKLDGFIKDILDYSRNSRVKVKADKIMFNDIILEVKNRLMTTSDAERLNFEIKINNDIPYYSDIIRFEIIFNNLFSNAIRYQDFQKESSQVSIQINTSVEKVEIKFSDNGIGIEKKNLKKIFDMFYRASDISKGSGLGLYIVKETIDKLGGSIKVETEFGVFTTFKIIIPNIHTEIDDFKEK